MNVNNVPAMVGFDDIDYSNAFSWNGIVFVKVHPAIPVSMGNVSKSADEFNAVAVGLGGEDYRYFFNGDDLVVPAYNLQFNPFVKNGVQPQKNDDNREDYGYGYKNRYGSYRGY